MPITKIDSDIYRSSSVGHEQSSYVAINPDKCPGSFVFAGSIAARETLGGQVACRLALENFSTAVLNFFDSGNTTEDLNIAVLEEAFRAANMSVYQFGHSLAAGGRMAASLIAAVIHDGIVAVGRVGDGCAVLIRDGKLMPFFETQNTINSHFIGSNSLVQVELSSIEIREGDILGVFSNPLPPKYEQILTEYFIDCDFSDVSPASEVCQYVFPDLVNSHFALVAKAGADTIYLKEIFEP
jgi:hypothetical protein